nr:transposon TX1 uncharacterized [Tanacetum cinerariifolium]
SGKIEDDIDSKDGIRENEQLSEAESNKLERQVNSGEIKKVVWDSRSHKALGSDGFSFQFLKRYWDLFKDDLEALVNDLFATTKPPSGSSSFFITLIPKLSEAESNKLERQVNSGEIKKVVWDSRSHKALGSDGFSFQFL